MAGVGDEEIVDIEMHDNPEKTMPGVPNSLLASDHATMTDLSKAARGVLAYIEMEDKPIDEISYTKLCSKIVYL